MASPSRPRTDADQAMPTASLTNPPATADQVQEADRARAALGASGQVPRQRSAPPAEADAGPARRQPFPRLQDPEQPEPAQRFEPPQELEFFYTPLEPQRIRNNNVPLTFGLLASIGAAFLVFFVSLAGSTAGPDPIMPAFWRALGALAVLTTLSFAASWFMPAPTDRRTLLSQIEAEDGLSDDRSGVSARRRRERTATVTPAPAEDEPEEEDATSKGTSIDFTVADDAQDGADFDDLEDEDAEDFGTSPFLDEDDELDDEEDLAPAVARREDALAEQGR